MITQAYFENIQDEIIGEIRKAKKNIYVAVAWLTDKVIFHELCEQAKCGVSVELMLINDVINTEYTSLDHNKLTESGGKVYFVEPSKQGAIMHHKFCVIDESTVITGSYNWSKKAQYNDENVVITSEASELGRKFIQEYNSIKDRILNNKFSIGQVDLPKILKRLEVIKSLILLEESEDIIDHVRKIKEGNVSAELVDIIARLEQKQYGTAVGLIEKYKIQQSQIVAFDDPELFALQLELKSLELQINAVENEKIEVEKSIQEFSIQYNQILGETIIEILKLKKKLALDSEEKKQAEKDEEEFREEYANKKKLVIKELGEIELKQLKKLYREASMHCHPDKFLGDPAKTALAEQMFISLTEAYKLNDLDKVKVILSDLKNGVINSDNIKQSDKKEVLKSRIAGLLYKMDQITADLNKLKLSATYRIIVGNADLFEYFGDLKDKLNFELESLEKELKATT